MGLLSKTFGGLKSGIVESLGGNGHDKIFNRVGQWVNNISGQTDAFNSSVQSQWAFWNANNWYNSPEHQMELYKAAGINPNMVANSGIHAVATGTSPQKNAGGASILSMLAQFFGIKADLALKAAQTKVANNTANYIGEQARALDMENNENSSTGTSRATPYPVRIAKQVVDAVDRAANGIAGSDAARSMTNSDIWNTFDDVLSGSYEQNRRYYKSLKSDKARKLYKRNLKSLRGYSDDDFKGW